MRRRIFFGFWLFTMGVICLAHDQVRVQLVPMDIQENEGDHYFSSIYQIESDGELLYIRSTDETQILVLDATGQLVKVIGGGGDHPSEFGHSGVMGMALSANGLWAFDNDMTHMRYFKDGIYQNRFRMTGFNYWYSNPTSNVFAVTDDILIVPAEPESGHLARVLRSDGSLVQMLGDPMPNFQYGPTLSGLNDTFWLAGGNQWICIHKFYPLITVFNQQFQVVKQFEINSAAIDQAFGIIENFQVSAKMSAPMSVFSDAKWFDDTLFLMGGGQLHRVDLASETVTDVVQFYGEGEAFEAVKTPSVYMYLFSFLKDGRAVVAHPGLLWGHDLWLAEVPFVNGTQSKGLP